MPNPFAWIVVRGMKLAMSGVTLREVGFFLAVGGVGGWFLRGAIGA